MIWFDRMMFWSVNLDLLIFHNHFFPVWLVAQLMRLIYRGQDHRLTFSFFPSVLLQVNTFLTFFQVVCLPKSKFIFLTWLLQFQLYLKHLLVISEDQSPLTQQDHGSAVGFLVVYITLYRKVIMESMEFYLLIMEFYLVYLQKQQFCVKRSNISWFILRWWK